MSTRTIDWYRTPIGEHELKTLNERSDLLGFLQAGGHLLCVVATGTLAFMAYRNLVWPWGIAAVFLHGTVSAFTVNAIHELVHGTVFKTKALNTVFARVFAFLGWHNHELFWTSHTEHHKFTLHPPDDLEVVLPMGHSLKGYFKSAFINPPALLQNIRHHWRIGGGRFQAGWETTITNALTERGRRRITIWSRIVLGGHLALTLIFLVTGQWILVILVSLLPCYGTWLFYLCNNTQHTGLADHVSDFRICCRTIILNPILRFLYWHMNYHIEHHMYAGVPCYKLGKLHRIIKPDLPPCPNGLLATWVQIGHILNRQKFQPDYQYIQPLPGQSASDDSTIAKQPQLTSAPPERIAMTKPTTNSRGEPFRLWECSVCGFIYDESKGLPEEDIAPGTAWLDIPDDWRCPDCGVAKSDFTMVEITEARAAAHASEIH